MREEEFQECLSLDTIEGFMNRAMEIMEMDQGRLGETLPKVMEAIVASKQRDPVLMYEEVIEEMARIWSATPSLPVHGAWHHFMVPGIIVKSLQNNGYDLSDEQVREAIHRGSMMPGGGCGFHGVCGAGSGAGIAISVILGSNPLHDENRSRALKASCESYRRIAKLGGPRCCVLSTYTSIRVAAMELAELGYDLPMSKLGGRCPYSESNPDCHRERCPYYPRV
jgi:hypothetical protein